MGEVMPQRPGVRRRQRGGEPRGHKVTVRLSDGELAAITAAADRGGLSAGAYIGHAALEAAGYRGGGITEAQRAALAELIRAAGLVRRAGVNLNQAVARLHATGQLATDLEAAAAYCMRMVGRIDQAATEVSRRLR